MKLSLVIPCIVEDLGLIPYATAWEYQHQRVAEKLSKKETVDRLLLCEHPPVYTLGTGASLDFLKFNPQETGWEVYRVERGGEVTYHCPQQLVVYPILDLTHYQTDLHWYLRQLEEVVIRVLRGYDLTPERIEGLTGVWVQNSKIAAVGIKVKRWVTMHGFAINVCPDLRGFESIIPCGIVDRPVGSIAQFCPEITLEQVKKDVITRFQEVFTLS